MGCRILEVLRDELPQVGWVYWMLKEMGVCMGRETFRTSPEKLAENSPGYSAKQIRHALARIGALKLHTISQINRKYTVVNLHRRQGTVQGTAIYSKKQSVLKSQVTVQGNGVGVDVVVDVDVVHAVRSFTATERPAERPPTPSLHAQTTPPKQPSETPPPIPPKVLPPPVQLFLETFNELCPRMSRVVEFDSDERRRLVAAAWAKKPTMDFWRGVFRRANLSDFVTGNLTNGQRNVKRGIEFILTSWHKIVEGNYDNVAGLSTIKPLARYQETRPSESELLTADYIAQNPFRFPRRSHAVV